MSKFTDEKKAELRKRSEDGFALSLPELAAATGYTYYVLYRMSKEPGFPYYRRRITLTDFNAWLKRPKADLAESPFRRVCLAKVARMATGDGTDVRMEYLRSVTPEAWCPNADQGAVFEVSKAWEISDEIRGPGTHAYALVVDPESARVLEARESLQATPRSPSVVDEYQRTLKARKLD